jgi:hypothetical protein
MAYLVGRPESRLCKAVLKRPPSIASAEQTISNSQSIEALSKRRFSKSGAGLFAKLLQDRGQRAEAGEGRLQQVETDEAGKPKPQGAEGRGEDGGDEDEAASDGENDALNGHDAPR